MRTAPSLARVQSQARHLSVIHCTFLRSAGRRPPYSRSWAKTHGVPQHMARHRPLQLCSGWTRTCASRPPQKRCALFALAHSSGTCRALTHALSAQPQFAYPEGDPDAVTLRNTDLQRLQPGEYLNDNIIDFCLKKLQARARAAPLASRDARTAHTDHSLVDSPAPSPPAQPALLRQLLPPALFSRTSAALPKRGHPQQNHDGTMTVTFVISASVTSQIDVAQRDPARAARFHFFNCFFWKKVSNGYTSSQQCAPAAGDRAHSSCVPCFASPGVCPCTAPPAHGMTAWRLPLDIPHARRLSEANAQKAFERVRTWTQKASLLSALHSLPL